MSGHFAFGPNKWAKEVKHDPNIFFAGEEINLTVRSFTHGYDLFHPHKIICWHEYTRKGRTKQWDDDKTWGEKNKFSHSKNRRLFSMDGEVFDPEDHDQIVGISKVAAKKAVMETAISRYVLCVTLFLPALALYGIERAHLMPRNRLLCTTLELSLFFGELYLAVPLAIALYP